MASLSSASCRSTISFDCSGETIAASSNSTLSAPPPRFWLADSWRNQQRFGASLGRRRRRSGRGSASWIGLVGQAQISLVDQRRRLQCVIGTLSAHLTMSEASEFLIDQRSQFREGSIVPVTPSHQEIGHSLLRNRRRIHNRSHSLSAPKSLCTPKASPEKISIQMITLIALFALSQ